MDVLAAGPKYSQVSWATFQGCDSCECRVFALNISLRSFLQYFCLRPLSFFLFYLNLPLCQSFPLNACSVADLPARILQLLSATTLAKSTLSLCKGSHAFADKLSRRMNLSQRAESFHSVSEWTVSKRTLNDRRLRYSQAYRQAIGRTHEHT